MAMNYIHACGTQAILNQGPYPLGDFGVIGDKIGRQRPILVPILSPITLWVWPINWATGRPSPGDLETTDLYQACLIFHCRLVSRHPATSRSRTKQLSGYGAEFFSHSRVTKKTASQEVVRSSLFNLIFY